MEDTSEGRLRPPLPDVVYVVKANDRNEELRYSLRTLANIPHGRVWMAGYRPTWVAADVGHIPMPDAIRRKLRRKWDISTGNLTAACGHPEVSDWFLLFNDDFFVMEPFDEMPVYHRGPLHEQVDYRGSSPYQRGIRETEAFMRAAGLDGELLSYEVHAPMPVHKDRMARVLAAAAAATPRIGVLHKRTLYGNTYAIGGERVNDCKVHGERDMSRLRGMMFLSTTDNSFTHGGVGRYIRRRFPDPSPYERT